MPLGVWRSIMYHRQTILFERVESFWFVVDTLQHWHWIGPVEHFLEVHIQFFTDNLREFHGQWLQLSIPTLELKCGALGLTLPFPLQMHNEFDCSRSSHGGMQLMRIFDKMRLRKGVTVLLLLRQTLWVRNNDLLALPVTGKIIQPSPPVDFLSLPNEIIPTNVLSTKGLQQQFGFHDVWCNEPQGIKERINGWHYSSACHWPLISNLKDLLQDLPHKFVFLCVPFET